MKNDKCLKSIILTLTLMLPINVVAHDFEVDGIYYNIISENEVEVTYRGTSYYQYTNEYVGLASIPTIVTYNDTAYYVTSIGDRAFYSCTGLTSIEIPNSVTSIGSYAFSDCYGLTSIEIPNSVTSIGNSAFYYCTGLTSIEIPNSVTSIGSYAFHYTAWYNNQSDGIIYAGLVAYKYKGTMPDGTRVTLIDGTKGIAGLAFSDCYGLTSIEIPNSVTSIGESAFSGCDQLTNIIVDSGNTIYDSRDNSNAIMETSTNTLITGCKTTVIPNSVKSIGSHAFSDCTGLTSIEIPNSVTSIGNYAFYRCTGLTSIEIGNSVTDIGYYAFNDCNDLTNVYCYAKNPPTCSDNDNTFGSYSATLHVPASSLAAYFIASIWDHFESIVGDAVAPTGISISKDSVNLQLDEQLQLTATVTPDNASNKEITWISSDTTVATVNNGVVLAVGYGECDIIASCFGMQAICHILVTNIITLDQQEAMLLPNHILTLTPTAHTAPKYYTVYSSDPTVAAARVVSSGLVQVVGIKEGTTTITVDSADGTAVPATCLVTVYTEAGDLNSDGFVAIGDVTLLIDYLLGGDESSVTTKNADINGDGKISISDITSLIDILLSETE